MPEASFGKSSRWLSTFTLKPTKTSFTPECILKALARHNIEARHVWKPLHQQPLFEGKFYYSHHPDFSVSDDLFLHGICLPSGSNLSLVDQNRVIDALRKILEK